MERTIFRGDLTAGKTWTETISNQKKLRLLWVDSVTIFRKYLKLR